MHIDKHLSTLAQEDPALRRKALEEVLIQEKLSYTCQEEVNEQTLHPARNYLLLPDTDQPCPLFCAHYDAFPGSCGANDNAAALCILITLAAELKRRDIPAAFAFLDGEERGHTGAKLFEEQRQQEFSAAVILDMCGYGDTLAVYSKIKGRQNGAPPLLDKALLSRHKGVAVSYLPEGDDKCFSSRRQPVFSIAMMPRWDLQFLKSLANLGSGLLGRPPEAELILGEMEVVTTMHGGFRDQIKWIQPEAMTQVYDYLLEAVTLPPSKPRRGLFGRS